MTESSPIEVSFYPSSTSAIIGMLSLVSTFLVLVLGAYINIFKEKLGKMVFIVNFTDFVFYLSKFSVFVIPPESDIYCKVLIAVEKTASLSSVVWSTFFAHILYMVAKYPHKDAYLASFNYYAVISAVFCGGLGFSTAFTNFINYSPAKQICVHPIWPGKTDVTYLIFGLLPITICGISGIILYILAGMALKRHGAVMQPNKFFLLLVYPAIILVCWLPQLTINSLESLGISQSQDVRMVMQCLIYLQGFLDAIVYGARMSFKVDCKQRSIKDERLDSLPSECSYGPEEHYTHQDEDISAPLSVEASLRFSIPSLRKTTLNY